MGFSNHLQLCLCLFLFLCGHMGRPKNFLIAKRTQRSISTGSQSFSVAFMQLAFMQLAFAPGCGTRLTDNIHDLPVSLCSPGLFTYYQW